MTDLIKSPQALPAGREEVVTVTPLDDPPLLGTLAIVLRHLPVMVLVPLATAALAIGMTLLTRAYTAVSKITPQTEENSVAGLVGVAAQFGMTVGGRQNESVDFYADLFKSRELMDSLAVTRYRFAAAPGDTLEGTYIELMGIKGDSFSSVVAARRHLSSRVSVSVKRTASLLTITTKAKWGMLAEQLNRRLLDLANSFNLHRRQTQARAERAFLEARLTAAEAELAEAQDADRAFRERNRVFEGDPALSARAQNLGRRVNQAAQTFEAVRQSYERARAEEVRNTPVITVVESPEGSRRRTGGLKLAALLGMAAGVVLAAGIALTLEYAETEKRRSPEAWERIRTLVGRRIPGRRGD
jgi:uncharacterized protein involved in exopolysaccharide biosynthesis